MAQPRTRTGPDLERRSSQHRGLESYLMLPCQALPQWMPVGCRVELKA